MYTSVPGRLSNHKGVRFGSKLAFAVMSGDSDSLLPEPERVNRGEGSRGRRMLVGFTLSSPFEIDYSPRQNSQYVNLFPDPSAPK